jgi:FkbM family methyltransferase
MINIKIYKIIRGPHKKIILASILILIIILALVFFYIKYRKQNNETFNDIPITTSSFESNIEIVKNPYIKTNTPTNTPGSTNINSADVIWQKQDTDFMKNNFPSTFEFDNLIKEDIIAKALTLPHNHCIIDCGAHIGDGSIPIAHALKYHNREDIIVYAIDPSKYKCDFIEFIKQKNNLNNLIVLNYGLSNVNNTYKSLQQSGANSGAWDWVSTNDNIENQDIVNRFIKLDDLVKDNIIKHHIGIIHFDVEGMEKEAIQGSIDTITKYKPYMSIENNHKSGKDANGAENSANNQYFIQFLPEGYKHIYNKQENNILISE